MISKTVYLAGPISGLSYEEATDWRHDISEALRQSNIHAISPLRGKVYIRDTTRLDQASPDIDVEEEDEGLHGRAFKLMSTSNGIMTRDYFDCQNAGVLLVNLLDTDIVSIGTCMEIAWAYANKTPIVLVMEDDGNIHDHAMIREAVRYGFRVPALSDAVEIIKLVLGAYP